MKGISSFCVKLIEDSFKDHTTVNLEAIREHLNEERGIGHYVWFHGQTGTHDFLIMAGNKITGDDKILVILGAIGEEDQATVDLRRDLTFDKAMETIRLMVADQYSAVEG